jgi:hypothetical protein
MVQRTTPARSGYEQHFFAGSAPGKLRPVKTKVAGSFKRNAMRPSPLVPFYSNDINAPSMRRSTLIAVMRLTPTRRAPFCESSASHDRAFIIFGTTIEKFSPTE